VFDDCGEAGANTYGLQADGCIDYYQCQWKNSAGAYSMNIPSCPALKAGITKIRRVAECSFDKPVRILEVISFNVSDLVCIGVPLITGDFGSTNPLRNIFIYRHEENPGVEIVNVSHGSETYDWYLVHDGNGINPHFLGHYQNGVANRPTIYEGHIFEFAGFDPQGDCIVFSTPPPGTGTAAQNPVYIRKCITLPNGAGASPGCLFTATIRTAFNSNKYSIFATNNTTFCGNAEGGMTISEGTVEYIGLVGRCSSNIVWDTTPRGYVLKDVGDNLVIVDAVTIANVDYNLRHNLLTGTCTIAGSPQATPGYNALEFSGSGLPGAHDIDADPAFVDPTRNMRTWDASLGGPGTYANAIAEMSRVSDPGRNPAYTLSNLRAYIREGFRPTNEALRGAGDPRDGAPDMGAVAMTEN
jgi:hypothetical protein